MIPDSNQITIHIHRASVIERKVEVQDCPTCKSRQEFLIEYLAYYGSDATCLNCGERWNDGEMCPRPFMRGWRKRSIENARKRIGQPVDPDSNKDGNDEHSNR